MWFYCVNQNYVLNFYFFFLRSFCGLSIKISKSYNILNFFICLRKVIYEIWKVVNKLSITVLINVTFSFAMKKKNQETNVLQKSNKTSTIIVYFQ